jgi:hypothetical protein
MEFGKISDLVGIENRGDLVHFILGREGVYGSFHLARDLKNFLITFGPGFIQQLKHRGEVADRRRRFESAKSDVAYFHKCHVCGKTEIDDATLDFRITASGDEICNACRAAKTLE